MVILFEKSTGYYFVGAKAHQLCYCVCMPDDRVIASGPALTSSLTAAWLRITGKDHWLPVTATVYSCNYTDLPNQIDSEVGHYHVTYTYRVDGDLYTGRFIDFGRFDEEYFKRNDTLVVRFNPCAPAKSYYPALRTETNSQLKFAATGAALGILAVTIYALVQHWH